MSEFSFTIEQRLRHKEEFARVYDRRMKEGDRFLLVFADRNERLRTRIGLSVSRKHGGAVRRVRIKRLLREAFRLEQHTLPAGLDLILIPRVGAGAELPDFRRSLVRLVRRLAARLEPSQSRGPS